MFASRINAQLHRFFAYRPDPNTEVINTLCVSCLSFLCFIFDNAIGILIVPNWPRQFWFTVLQDLLLREAFIILPKADDLNLPNQPDHKYPFSRNQELMVCLVSGKALVSSSIYPVGF